MKAGDILSSRYVLGDLIGRGGMQNVYKAFDKLLDMEVALKTPQPGQPDKKFKRSAKIAARINHHNVAKTLDYFEENDRLFLIEEYVPGENLEEKLKRFRAVDPHLGVRVFLHLAKGVAASHKAGVIHRDLKPSNIMTEFGVNLHQLKITDFGIATLTEEVFEQAAKDGELTKSASGTIKGAIPYMAPEMMFRRPGDNPGSEVDIWSLGALMFRIMTGEYPYGVFLDAAVNVKTRNRQPWPGFMTANPQFKPLAEQVQNLIDLCLNYDPKSRPTAEDLVKQLSELCYLNSDRIDGTVTNFIQQGHSGFASDFEGGVFFSMESVYGLRKPSCATNNRICYARYPGSPRYRGHPIVVID